MPNFKLMKREIDQGDSRVRVTATKLLILGEYCGNGRINEDIEIWKNRSKRRSEAVKIKWSGHIEVESNDTQKCDLGHFHAVKKEKHFVWNYAGLSKSDLLKIIEFLKEA